MSQNARVDKLWNRLTAKERAILVLRAFKEGTAEPPDVRRRVLPHQIDEFNRYVSLINGVNRNIGQAARVLGLMVDQMELRVGLLMSLHLWSIEVTRLWRCIQETKVPITESEYAKLKGEEAQKLIPLIEAADMAAEIREEDWDVEEGEDEDAVREKLVQVWAERLEEAVRSGRVEGEKGPDGLELRLGSFHGWLGEPLDPYPDYGSGYEVLPDSEAQDVAWRKKLRESALDAFRDSPSSYWTCGYASQYAEELRGKSLDDMGYGDRTVRDLIETIKMQLIDYWAELRAIEIVMEEAAGEFDGEDPAHPQLREEINSLKEDLSRFRDQAVDYFGGVDLEEPVEEELESMRKLMLGTQI